MTERAGDGEKNGEGFHRGRCKRCPAVLPAQAAKDEERFHCAKDAQWGGGLAPLEMTVGRVGRTGREQRDRLGLDLLPDDPTVNFDNGAVLPRVSQEYW